MAFQTISNFSASTESGVRSGRDKRYLNYLQWIEAGVIKKSFKMNIRTTIGDAVKGDPTLPHPHSFILSLQGLEMNGLAIHFQGPLCLLPCLLLMSQNGGEKALVQNSHF